MLANERKNIALKTVEMGPPINNQYPLGANKTLRENDENIRIVPTNAVTIMDGSSAIA